MNACCVFLYKHVKTCEPLMKCSILEARGSYTRCQRQEAAFSGLGPPYANDSSPLSKILCHLRTRWTSEVMEMSHFNLQKEKLRPERKQIFFF